MADEAMPSIAIFYGSSTGNTQEAAEKIQGELSLKIVFGNILCVSEFVS